MVHMYDENVFFREATLRMCGTLDIEVGLHRTFEYLCKFIPLERIALHYIDFDRQSQMLLAAADENGGEVRRESVELTEEAIGNLLSYPDSGLYAEAVMEPMARRWVRKGLLGENTPLMYLRLFSEDKVVGAMTFMGRQGALFHPEHLKRLETLRDPFSIALSNAVRYRKLVEIKDSLDEDNRFLRKEILQTTSSDLVGAGGGLATVVDTLRQVAPQSCPVLLLGETGTGKELLARSIHRMSSRSEGPFVACNCGAIPGNLVDSELFGHEKGAFTGADSARPGRFERAHGGTIFLDEIGELKPEVQVRLLRVLQEKEVERIGGSRTIPVDIRVLAATHRDLHAMCREGEFREDLLFRLSVVPVTIPPLRERVQDIGPLVQHFLLRKARDMGMSGVPGLAEGALERLERYDWPGNVRELENAVERALILNRGGLLSFRDIGRMEQESGVSRQSSFVPESDSLPTMDEAAADLILRALGRTGGRVGGEGGAADLLGVNPSTLRKRMKRLQIPFGRNARY